MSEHYAELKDAEKREEDKKAEVKEEPEQVAETEKDQESLGEIETEYDDPNSKAVKEKHNDNNPEEQEQVTKTEKEQESLEETERKNIKDDHGLPKSIEIQTTENTSDFTIKTGNPKIPFRRDDVNLLNPPSTSGDITDVAKPRFPSPVRPPIRTQPYLGQHHFDTRREIFEEVHLPEPPCCSPSTDKDESPEDDKCKCPMFKNCFS